MSKLVPYTPILAAVLLFLSIASFTGCESKGASILDPKTKVSDAELESEFARIQREAETKARGVLGEYEFAVAEAEKDLSAAIDLIDSKNEDVLAAYEASKADIARQNELKARVLAIGVPFVQAAAVSAGIPPDTSGELLGILGAMLGVGGIGTAMLKSREATKVKQTLSEVVSTNEEVIRAAEPDKQARIKAILRAAQSPETQGRVKALRESMDV